MEEAGEANQGAQLHLDQAIPAARNGHPFRDYTANLQVSAFSFILELLQYNHCLISYISEM